MACPGVMRSVSHWYRQTDFEEVAVFASDLHPNMSPKPTSGQLR